MSNPFDDLYRQRMAKEEKQRQQREVERQAEKRKTERHQLRVSAEKRLHPMVTKVLEQLQQAAYPSLQIRGWSIGSDVSDSESRSTWSPLVSVTLLYNEKDLPTGFGCYRGKFLKECGLSEGELIDTLKRLHSCSFV